MGGYRLIGVFVATVAVALMFSKPSLAVGGCMDIPQGVWWGKTNHSKIISYVERRHDGDWVPYIGKWERQLKTMKGIAKRSGSAVFKKKGLTLKGKKLDAYVTALKVRVDAIGCLSRNNDVEQAARKLNDMNTAAGGK